MLQFDPRWIFQPPADDELHHGSLPGETVQECLTLIRRVIPEDYRQGTWETFKRGFYPKSGRTYSRSSDSRWAEYDCEAAMFDAASNAPVWIGTFYSSWKELEGTNRIPIVGIEDLLNGILVQTGVGYVVEPPNLRAVGQIATLALVELPAAIGTVERQRVEDSLQLATEHMDRGDFRNAVMESLWLLDSAIMVYQGLVLPTGRVAGAYFTPIVGSLRRLNVGASLAHIMGWMNTMYGYLSSPGGGQVRHGMDLSAELALTANEARLYCNLIRAYIEYLLAEHERLTRGGTP
jgi:hypothetical protein